MLYNKRKFGVINKKDVNKIKNHTASAIAKLHGLTFICFEIAYISADKIVNVYLPDAWWGVALGILYDALSVAIIYWSIYYLLKYIYNKIIDRNTKFDIDGEWYHVHIPHIRTERPSLSAGVTYITRNLKDFTFYSLNYDFYVKNGEVTQKNDEWKTQWFTETSEICDDNNEIDIVEVYKAVSNEEQTIEVDKCPICKSCLTEAIPESKEHRYGIHKYKIHKNQDIIVCDYSDCWPSLKSGKLYLYKDKAERDKKIREYFRCNEIKENILF